MGVHVLITTVEYPRYIGLLDYYELIIIGNL